MTDSTKVLWRVQVREGRWQKWQNMGLFETRKAARDQAAYLRAGRLKHGLIVQGIGVGFGNTRVVRHERTAK